MNSVVFSILTKAGLAIAVVSALSVGFIGGFATHSVVAPAASGQQQTAPQVLLHPTAPGACSWQSDPFAGVDAAEASPLALHDACGKVQGTVTAVVIRVQGETTTYHFLLKPDASYAAAVNAQNTAQQDGALVVEIEPTDASVMPMLHVNQHLEVQGPLVTDTDAGHGWNEIHPAKVIATL